MTLQNTESRTLPHQSEALSSREIAERFNKMDNLILDITSEDEYFDLLDSIGARDEYLSDDEINVLALAKISDRYATTYDLDPTDRAVLNLLAATPNYVFQEARLLEAKQNHTRDELALHSASDFNSRIRDLAQLHPETSVNQLEDTLVTFFDRTHVYRYAAPSTIDPSEQIAAAIAGTRAEVAFEEWLSAGDVPFKRGTLKDDIHGIDYYVNYGDKQLPIDLKKSTTGSGATTELFRITEGNSPKIYLTSPIQASEFNGDTFALHPDVAENASVTTKILFDQIIKKL